MYCIHIEFKSWGYNIDIRNRPVFICMSNGLLFVLDKKARQRYSIGLHTKSHNVLSGDDVLKLYYSKLLAKSTPKVYHNMMKSNLGLFTGVWPTRLQSMEISQFNQLNLGEVVMKYTRTICSDTGGYKEQDDEERQLDGGHRNSAFILNQIFADNVFVDSSEYMSIISKFFKKTKKVVTNQPTCKCYRKRF